MTELSFVDVATDNRVFRIDSQYFNKTALEVEKRLKDESWAELKDISDEVESFGAYDLTNYFQYVDEGVPFLRCVNIKNGFTDFFDVLYITSDANKLLHKSEVRAGMVLLTMSGTVGAASVALDDWSYPINSNQDIAKITPKPGLDPFFLASFLNSRYGQVQIQRLPVGSVQQHVFLWMIEKLIVSRFSPELERSIASCAKAAFDTQKASTKELQQAEGLLLDALGLNGWQPPQPRSYVRRASAAFAAGRLDSDFFSPRVTELIAQLQIDNLKISDVAPVRREKFVSQDQGEFDYIEISDVQSDGIVTSERLQQVEAPSRATWYVRAGDVITSTVRPIRRLSAIVEREQSGFVCSSGFAVLRPTQISPELLFTYLRLPQICQLMDLYTSASMYPAISESDLLALPFRQVPDASEQGIIEAIQSGRRARRQSQALLAQARRAVEIAIERNEAEALRFLSEPLSA